jgi:hypothetical protein
MAHPIPPPYCKFARSPLRLCRLASVPLPLLANVDLLSKPQKVSVRLHFSISVYPSANTSLFLCLVLSISSIRLCSMDNTNTNRQYFHIFRVF